MALRGPRLTIPTRIFLSIVLVLLFFGAVSGASVYQHQQTAQRLRLLEHGYLPLQGSLEHVRASQEVIESSLDRLLEERDAEARRWMDEQRTVRSADLTRAMTRVRRARELSPTAEDAATLEEIGEDLAGVRADYAASERQLTMVDAAVAGGDAAGAQRARESLREGEARAGRRVRRMRRLVESLIGRVSGTIAEQERQFVLGIAAMAFVAMLVGLVVLWWTNRLLQPLPRLQQRVEAVARGELEGKIAPRRDDEIGRLTTEFERMVDAVRKRDLALREAAETLRELQKMQEQIVTGLRAGVIVVDEAGLVRSANKSAATVLSIVDVNAPLEDTGLLDRLEGLSEAIDRVAEGGPRASLRAAVLDERFVDVLVTPFGVDEATDGRRSVLVVADDVTDEVKTKARLIQTERLAAIGRMAAHVTHEVRNPLSSIGLNVELLEEEIEDRGAEPKALLRSIQREIDRLTEVTEEYLRLARLPMPRLEPEPLGELVDEVGRFVSRELEASGVTLSVDVAGDLPLVAADEPQIRQALLNLLRNAKDAMPEGGEVKIDARPLDGGLAIRVRDHGEGIAEEARRHIFDLFYSTKERGTGLGLPLTQQIVAAHGGRIVCEDADGGGTLFTMWFPAARLDDDAPAEVAAPRQ